MLGLTDQHGDSPPASLHQFAVNPRFGLIALCTEHGLVHLITTQTYPIKPRLVQSLDLKRDGNLRELLRSMRH